MARENYAAQVALLVRILPYVAKEEIFTLQGGTARKLLSVLNSMVVNDTYFRKVQPT